MKSICTAILLSLLVFSNATAQAPNKSYRVRYEATYQKVPIGEANATLYFNDTCSLYLSDDYAVKHSREDIVKRKEKTNDGKEKVTISTNIPFEGELVWTSFTRMVLQFPAMYRVHMENVACVVEEQLPLMQWELRAGHKQFDGYQANEAYCQFRGRKYQAWYIPAIPTMAGPWKFNGLPGLIVEVKDEDNAVLFNFKSVETIAESWPNYELPNEVEKLDIKSYMKRDYEGLQELVGILTSKSGRNQGGTSGIEIQRDDRELNFDDVQ